MIRFVALLSLMLMVLLGADAPAVVAADRHVRIGVSSVFGDVPAGFETERNFPGLNNRDLNASIVVVELAREMPLMALFSSTAALNETFVRGGIRIDEVEKLTTTNGATLLLARGTQTSAKGNFRKWIGAMTGPVAAMITFQIDERSEFSPDAVRAFYRSLTFGEKLPVSEVLDRLSFTLDIVEPFRFSASVEGGGVLLVAGEDALNRNSREPIIMALLDVNTPPGADLEHYAAAALRSTSSFRQAEIRSSKVVEFAGREGIELEGVTLANGIPFVFKQRLVLTDEGAALRVVAAGPEAAVKRLDAEIERIFASISLK